VYHVQKACEFRESMKYFASELNANGILAVMIYDDDE
jgi:deoxyribodipyrimidine photolyase-like uncharacterized protein